MWLPHHLGSKTRAPPTLEKVGWHSYQEEELWVRMPVRNTRRSRWHLYKSSGTNENTFSFSLVLNAGFQYVALANLNSLWDKAGLKSAVIMCPSQVWSYHHKSMSGCLFLITCTSLWYAPQNQKDMGRILGTLWRGSEGNVGRDLQAGSVRGSTSELHRGMVMSTSLLLDLKPPRLGIQVLTMDNPGSNKGVI